MVLREAGKITDEDLAHALAVVQASRAAATSKGGQAHKRNHAMNKLTPIEILGIAIFGILLISYWLGILPTVVHWFGSLIVASLVPPR